MEALDLHCELIMDEYREALPTLEAMQKEVLAMLREALDRNDWQHSQKYCFMLITGFRIVKVD